jgi:hypothetical protein
VEEGYFVSPLGGPAQRLPASPGPLFDSLAAGMSYEGALRLFPLPVNAAAAAFGWADATLLPAGPDPMDLTAAAAGGPVGFRGLYRHGPAAANDGAADPLGAVGDAFVCPCPAADTAAAAAAAAAGLPPRWVTSQAGRLAVAEGAHVHDGVRCAWAFGYSAVLRWTVVTLAPSAPALRLGQDRLWAAAQAPPPSGAAQGVGCYIAPCDLTAAAGASAAVLCAVPAVVVYEAGAAPRALGPRPQGTGGRFSVAFSQLNALPPEFALRSAALQHSHAPQPPQRAPLPNSTSSAVWWRGQTGGDAVGGSMMRVVGGKPTEEIRMSLEERMGRAQAAGGLRESNVVATTSQFLLSLTAVPTQEAPCRFAPGPSSALIR